MGMGDLGVKHSVCNSAAYRQVTLAFVNITVTIFMLLSLSGICIVTCDVSGMATG